MCFSWGLFLLNNLLLKEKTNCGQALSVVSLTKLKPFAFIIINKFYILIHFMIICIIIKMHWKRLFQMQDLHGVFTVCTRRAHNAPTALKKFPQNSHSALSNTLCKRQAASFILSMLKTNAATWRSRRLHSTWFLVRNENSSSTNCLSRRRGLWAARWICSCTMTSFTSCCTSDWSSEKDVLAVRVVSFTHSAHSVAGDFTARTSAICIF